jgi:hypothetical protein
MLYKLDIPTNSYFSTPTITTFKVYFVLLHTSTRCFTYERISHAHAIHLPLCIVVMSHIYAQQVS